MTDTAPNVQSKPEAVKGPAPGAQPQAQPQSTETGKTSKNQTYQMDYDKLMKKGVQPSNVQIYDASKRKSSALMTNTHRLSTKPVDEKSYMATTKAKFFRQAAI
jgi:hypothetical protein